MPQLQLLGGLPGHAEPAWCVTFNPTRNLLASCSTDRSIRLYSYTLPSPSPPGSTSLPSSSDSKPSFSLNKVIDTDHKRTVRSVAWSPDGRTLASGSFDSTVGVWEEVIPESDEEEDNEDGNQGVYRPAAGADEEDDDDDGISGKEKEWECVTTLEGHESECKSVGFSSDGALLASCSRDKSVWVWEVQPDADFECIAVMMEHSQDVKCIAWHPHEEVLASASYDSHIHLAFDDPDSDWTIFQKAHPKMPPAPLTIPSTSSSSLIAALMPTAEEKAAEQKLVVPPLEEDETIWSLAWSPCGRYLASGGDMGGIRIWQRRGTQPDSPFEEILHTAAHSRSVFSLSWTPSPSTPSTSETDLGLLASAGGDGKIVIWQVQLGTPSTNGHEPSESESEGHKQVLQIRPIAAVKDAHDVSDVNAVGWCVRDDKKGLGLLSSAGDDGSVKVWRIVSDE
ncbi:WD40 repeat protein Ciao1 [Kwoniella heveanensis BCC8398]|uniref:Probable cytosolic iron-sulfur protein assembly protein 1 n=1 Tax=Kwoniella heveanensis BCC8398 TaxID=1296120 RepID=A0A1B9GRY8_9TREE|nr:WD40 repeat protein Ciao1 [Kwoniella heveanensis BCC8398]